MAQRDRPAVEITDEMVSAGESVLEDYRGLHCEREMARAIYSAMEAARSPKDQARPHRLQTT